MTTEVVTPLPASDDSAGAEEMSLLDHLREVRNRVVISAVALVVGTAIAFFATPWLLKILTLPLGVDKKLLVTDPLSGLTSTFGISLTAGAVLALPVILYQLIAFILPGLLPKERNWLRFGFPAALILYALGAGFAWFVFVPNAINFLTSWMQESFEYLIKSDEYLTFVSGIVFWMGFAFEMPLIMFLLAKVNVLSSRVLAKNWRYAVVAIAVLAAFITPTPDPINMGLVMFPLLVLYGVSIIMEWLARRNATVPAILDPEEVLKGR